MWEANPERGIYIHYSRQGASRLDRIYVTRNLSDRKKGIETVVTAFTDHLAVVLRMALDVDIIRRGRSFWKMNATLMQDAQFQAQLRLQWKRWIQQRKYYPDIVTWWERSAKNKSGYSLYGKERKKTRNLEKWIISTMPAYMTFYKTQNIEQHETENVNRLKAQLIKAYRERAAAGMI
jgi:hypothetical protein